MLPTGTIVAGYRIDGELGEGGMSHVYRATQLSLNRVVALKLLSGELSDDPGFRARFQREGQLQAALDHEHIVTVYEAGQTEHGLFLALRLIDGPTLKDLILAGQLEPRRSLRLLAQVAQALDEAHEAGLIHRDIKPQNILVGRGDHAYLADFGLIKAPDDSARLTGTGQFMGTIDYVAPEQIQGDPATAVSDIYALTAVMFECLTGQVPFARPTEAATIHAHVTAPPPKVTELSPDMPPAIDDVIAAGMAKDPAARPPSASELIRAAQVALISAAPILAPAQETRLSPSPGTDSRPQVTRVPGTAPAVATVGSAPVAEATHVAGAPVVATAPEAPPAAAPPPPAAPARAPARPRGAPMGALIAVLGIAAIVAGFLVGHSGNTTKSVQLGSTAAIGNLQLRYPSAWQLGAAIPPVPGMSFSDRIALSPDPAGAGLSAGELGNATGPTLLPAAFRAKVQGGLPAATQVKLGQIEAYRYANLNVRGLSGPLTVYAAPTSAGVATIACWASPNGPRTFSTQCDEVAATLALVNASAFPLGPNAAYARQVSAAFKRLDGAIATPLSQLKAARTPSAQAAAATQLSKAYTTAASSLSHATVSPMDADVQGSLLSALRGISSGYARAAAAAHAGSSAGFKSASHAIDASSSALSKALRTLGSRGYHVGK